MSCRNLQHRLLQLDWTERERAQLLQQLPGDTIMLENMHDEWLMPYMNAAYNKILQLKVSAYHFHAPEQRAASPKSLAVCRLLTFHRHLAGLI